VARRTPTTPTAIEPLPLLPCPFFSPHSHGESIVSPSKDETLKKDGRPGGSRRRKGDETSREAAVVVAVAVAAAAVRMTHVKRGGKRETCRRHTMQVTARAPHRPCLISFVPGVSSAFFPMTARQPWCGSAWLGSSRLVSSRVVSALCRTEIAQMETSVSFSLRSPVTLFAFSLFLSLLPRFFLFSVLSFSLPLYLSHFLFI